VKTPRQPPPLPSKGPSSPPRVNIPSRKLSPSRAPLPTITETIVPIQKDIDTIIKNQAAKTFTAHLTTNFTRVAAYNENPKHQFEYQSCDIKVDKMTERSKHSQSVAKIYIAKTILSKSTDLIIKMWINDNSSGDIRCLNAEWAIYRYVIPFLFYRLITPCVLIPFQTGKCTAKDFTNKIRPLIHKLNSNEKSPVLSNVRYIATPNIPMSLYNFLNQNNSEIRHGMKSDMMYALMFHLVYTVTAFAALGLRHNRGPGKSSQSISVSVPENGFSLTKHHQPIGKKLKKSAPYRLNVDRGFRIATKGQPLVLTS
jgi:hypothetical protein